MTKEVAIRNLEMIRIAFVNPATKEQRKLINDTVDMAISALSENKGEWIPVSERLPEKNRAVLTYVDKGMTKAYCLAYWNDRVKGWEEWIGFRMLETEMGYKVLAWQPLPEPYKSEKGGEE